MSKMKNWLQTAVLEAFNPSPRDRLPGFHASQAGKCQRQAIIQALHPHLTYPLNQKTLGTFKNGHLIDKFVKEALAQEVYDEASMFLFTDHLYWTHIGDLKIVGETDATFIDFNKHEIHIVDTKSSKASAFSMVKKDNAPKRQNAMQVATYMMSEQVQEMLASGWKVFGWLMYVNKDNMDTAVFPVRQQHIDEAKQWWLDVDFMVGSEQIPKVGGDFAMVPQEVWECGYCSLFPPFDDSRFTTQTKEREARAQHRQTCYSACNNLDLKSKMIEVVIEEKDEWQEICDRVTEKAMAEDMTGEW